MAGSRDPLFKLRNDFYLGLYQDVINNHDLPDIFPDYSLECETLTIRSIIALGNYEIEDMMHGKEESMYLFGIYGSFAAFKSLRQLADYHMHLSKHSDMDSWIQKFKRHWEMLAKSAVFRECVMFNLVAGIIFMHSEDYYNEALKYTNAVCPTVPGIRQFGIMELPALNVQIYIKMHQLENAEKEFGKMQKRHVDHILTYLANASLNLAMGGPKIQEAYLIYQDLSEKYPMTGLILNGKAVCCIHMQKFEEAEKLLLQAFNKNAKDPETLANLVVCSLHLGKPSSGYLSELKHIHPEHALLKSMSSAEDAFDSAVQSARTMP